MDESEEEEDPDTEWEAMESVTLEEIVQSLENPTSTTEPEGEEGQQGEGAKDGTLTFTLFAALVFGVAIACSKLVL